MPQPEGAGRRRARLGRGEETSSPPEGGAAGRAIWSGSITFGLVTVPIELYSAQRRRRPALRMLSPDGTPLVRQYVCPAEELALEPDEIVRGYEVAPGEFVLVSDEELEGLAPRRSRDIELARFVPRGAIDPGYFERSYVLVPGGGQTKAYRLLAETMERTGRAAIASFVMREKAYAVAIFAERGILRAETLRYGDELRTPGTLGLPEAVEPDAKRVKRMQAAVEALAHDAVAESELQDDADERLLALARAKWERGDDVVEAPAAAPATAAPEAGGEVVDLMALLKERLRAPAGAEREAGARGRAKEAAAARKAERAEAAEERPAAARARAPAKRAGARRKGEAAGGREKEPDRGPRRAKAGEGGRRRAGKR